MKTSSLKTCAAGIASVLLLPFLAACGSDSKDEAAAGRTLVVEVGDGQPGLRLADDASGDGEMSSTEIQECSDVFGGEVEGWKVAGSENQLNIEPTEAFATKITGNQNNLNLIIKAKEGETGVVAFPGICLVMGGNKPSVNVTLNGVSLDAFKVVARGNNGTVSIKLENDAVLPEGAKADLGKHVTVSVTE